MNLEFSSMGMFLREINIHPRIHAKRLDKKIGFKIPKIEMKLLQKYRAYDKQEDSSSNKNHFQGTQTWIGLHPQALQSTYNEILEALLVLKDVQVEKIIDIGAGYGRVGLVMNAVFPQAEFIGYEIVKKRSSEANRIYEKYKLDNCNVELLNVLDDEFELPNADIYFIYDFSEIDDLDCIFKLLVGKMNHKQFHIIVHGERTEFLINKRYKKYWNKLEIHQGENLKVYSSTSINY
jgi:predicted O-methyltransferase YrrM